MAVGIAVVVPVARPWPAIAALVLPVAFTAVLLNRWRDGTRPPCACHGSWSRRLLGWPHLARNGLLLALAAIALLL